MSRQLAAGIAGLCFALCVVSAGVAQRAQQTGRVPLDARRSLGAPAVYQNLTLIPIYDSSAKATTPYLTLDEGLKSKKVRVKEKPGGGDVNTLLVTNTSHQPLYILGGEVVLGGQQDRTLGKDTVVPPGKKDQPVTVFCVEHGRWAGRPAFAMGAKAVAGKDIRASAQDAAFAAEAAALPPGPVLAGAGPAAATGRPAAGESAGQAVAGSRQTRGEAPAQVARAQTQVWDRVAAKNAKFKSRTGSGTYRAVLNQEGGEAGKTIAPYTKALAAGLGQDPHLVGVVAAVNGRIVAADSFGDAALFRKLWPKLLRSYAEDAAESAPAKPVKHPTVSAHDARAFLAAAAGASSKAENRSDVSTTLRLESKDALVYRLAPAGKAAPGAAGGMGGGRPVHESIIRK